MVDKKDEVKRKTKTKDKSDGVRGKSAGGGKSEAADDDGRQRKVGKAITLDDLEKLILEDKQVKKRKQSTWSQQGNKQIVTSFERSEPSSTPSKHKEERAERRESPPQSSRQRKQTLVPSRKQAVVPDSYEERKRIVENRRRASIAASSMQTEDDDNQSNYHEQYRTPKREEYHSSRRGSDRHGSENWDDQPRKKGPDRWQEVASAVKRQNSTESLTVKTGSDDKAAKPELMRRLNDKFRLIKDPQQFQILERKVEVLSAEREMLSEYNKALDEENNSLKTMMVELTKQRCRNDLEHLRKRQIDIEKKSLSKQNLETLRSKVDDTISSDRYKQMKEIERSREERSQLEREKEKNNLERELVNQRQKLDFERHEDVKPKRNTLKKQQTIGGIRKDRGFLKNDVRTESISEEEGEEELDEDGKPKKLLTVPLVEWDKLKYQADLVLEENQILVDQKKLYKNTIDELTDEFQTKMKKHSEEILLLMQDKNTLEEDLLLSNQDRDKLKEKIEEMKKAYSLLENRCDELVDEMENKIDLTLHKEQLEKLNRTKTSEINMMAKEIDTLKARYSSLSIEKDRLAIKGTNLTAENADLQYKMKVIESELKKLKSKLNQTVMKAEAASYQELIVRKTLSQVIKVAEKTVIDRNLLADIVRQEKLKDNKLKDAIFNNESSDGAILNFDGFEKAYDYGDKTYGDKTSGPSNHLGSPSKHLDKKLFEFDFGDKNDLHSRDNNISPDYGDNNKVFDRAKGSDIKGRLNFPSTDLRKFKEKQEMELNELKDMVRLKQTYIDHIQKTLPS